LQLQLAISSPSIRHLNIGSVLGFLPMPYMALYSATKHAVAGYSESLDHELRTMGIRVSVVSPPTSIRRSTRT
jgi:short-subunit dehydrogenase